MTCPAKVVIPFSKVLEVAVLSHHLEQSSSKIPAISLRDRLDHQLRLAERTRSQMLDSSIRIRGTEIARQIPANTDPAANERLRAFGESLWF